MTRSTCRTRLPDTGGWTTLECRSTIGDAGEVSWSTFRRTWMPGSDCIMRSSRRTSSVSGTELRRTGHGATGWTAMMRRTTGRTKMDSRPDRTPDRRPDRRSDRTRKGRGSGVGVGSRTSWTRIDRQSP